MFLPPLIRRATVLRPLTRSFTTTPLLLSKPLPPRRVILDSEIIENFLKGSGPGGQKINKTSSAVQLKHLPTGIVVKYQDTRSRSLNRKRARQILGEKIEELELGEEARTRVKAREKSKRKGSAEKKKRRKYRALEAGKEQEEGEEGIEEESRAAAVEGRRRRLRRPLKSGRLKIDTRTTSLWKPFAVSGEEFSGYG
ncbi:hypothetical protein P171DRAFT_46146 [Karstenula rhodostoma CBS 690.94]|uniref:Prokaryotic-type class I peptide chain release factors domain-containing protein n=1 Tax=Karstenula rhodostoma CBS 690.94 TaxID=1392251 RepID=A0A9P4UB53_9PLEO|nr:hypothetical protein P171DRAFT_46146 [Karstenula rhodostoma CBS 690.94]